ncbi:Immunoglobulin domain [Nesidiocoris tenuis]|uniref:Immunoglobulin domain n=1 Tax=Nesidiocoris tenuis TaxID=355587 RepID=A0ABN7A5S7_9HEMI|nr:Immunoglobulin domain [Nesidiocoris tenuis]
MTPTYRHAQVLTSSKKVHLFIAVFFTFAYGVLSDIELVPRAEEAERYVNSTYIVTCMGDGALSATWRGPNNQIIETKTGRVHVEEGASENTMQSVLVFERIHRQDQGNYTCTAYVKGQLQRASFTLFVVKPIAFHGQLEHQKLVEGRSMSIRCEVTGDPLPKVVWHVKHRPLKEGMTRYQQQPLGLFISNVTREDEGLYQCRAFQVTSKSSNLQVQNIMVAVDQRPRWPDGELNNVNVYGYKDGIANITCRAIGKPTPGYAWYRHNKTLDPSYTQVVHELGYSVLQVKMKKLTTELGEYQCLAENSVGSIMRRFVLLVGRKPRPPSRVSVMDVGAYKAFIDADATRDNEADAVIGYRILFGQVRQDGSVNWDQPEFQDVYIEGGEPYKIYDLVPDQTYNSANQQSVASALHIRFINRPQPNGQPVVVKHVMREILPNLTDLHGKDAVHTTFFFGPNLEMAFFGTCGQQF